MEKREKSDAGMEPLSMTATEADGNANKSKSFMNSVGLNSFVSFGNLLHLAFSRLFLPAAAHEQEHEREEEQMIVSTPTHGKGEAAHTGGCTSTTQTEGHLAKCVFPLTSPALTIETVNGNKDASTFTRDAHPRNQVGEFITTSQRKRGRRMSENENAEHKSKNAFPRDGGEAGDGAPPSARRRSVVEEEGGVQDTPSPAYENRQTLHLDLKREQDISNNGIKSAATQYDLLSPLVSNLKSRLDAEARNSVDDKTPSPESIINQSTLVDHRPSSDTLPQPSPSSTFFSPVFRLIGTTFGVTPVKQTRIVEESSVEDKEQHWKNLDHGSGNDESMFDPINGDKAAMSEGPEMQREEEIGSKDQIFVRKSATQKTTVPNESRDSESNVPVKKLDDKDTKSYAECPSTEEEACTSDKSSSIRISERPYSRWDHDVSELDELYLETLLFIQRLPPLDLYVNPYRECILPRKTRQCPKVTLVLDLDETLVHSSLEDGSDVAFSFPVHFNNQKHNVKVRCRPNLIRFMEHVSKVFEIVVFTASQKIYAETLLNILDPNRDYIRHRVYRDSCVVVDGNFIKDLTVLGRDIRTTIIVDNSPQAFGFQLENGVPIESWFDDENDVELLELLPFLDELVDVEDVRPYIRDKFRLREKAQWISNQSRLIS